MTLTDLESSLVGLNDSGLEAFQNTHLLGPVATALAVLQSDARQAGFDLRIASGYRDYQRQLQIWNAKHGGDRPVLNDADEPVSLQSLSVAERLRCVMRFSALPGASRHHWGTDIDVYDGAAVVDDYRVQLSLAEVAPGGVFGPFHAWLDERMDRGESYGFYRPYGRDRGAVAPERWHLSFAPLARGFQRQITEDLLRRTWEYTAAKADLALRPHIEEALPTLLRRYVHEVDEPHDAARHFAF